MKKFFLVTPALLINKALLNILKFPKGINKRIEKFADTILQINNVSAMYNE